ncbi:MAG: hypothetical protein J0I32_10890 [Sphingobacteriales bacterium]|nr:hypothetical protein [Sphingobacteriales bacterium]
MSKLIDNRNQEVWNVVKSRYDVNVVFHGSREHHVFYQNDMARISIPAGDYSADSFTHELLHLYLEVKEFRLSGFVLLFLKENKRISSILTIGLLHHISNVIDHAKMLPLYLQMGFKRELFLMDYCERKCEEYHLTIIEAGFQKDSLLRVTAIDLYIGKFFAIKSCPNPSFDYTPFLSRMREAEPSLYEILDKFWKAVVTLNIETTELHYHLELAGDFKDELEQWLALNVSEQQ